MKNIIVVPVEESNIKMNVADGRFIYRNGNSLPFKTTEITTPVEIYVIKEDKLDPDDYAVLIEDGDKVYKPFKFTGSIDLNYLSTLRKIVLTSDRKLYKDGVGRLSNDEIKYLVDQLNFGIYYTNLDPVIRINYRIDTNY